MAAPTEYTPDFDFSAYQATNPDRPLPGHELDVELNNISDAISGTQAALSLIQRSDGKLANGSVGFDALVPSLRPFHQVLTLPAFAFTATSGQTVYTLPEEATQNNVLVFVDGARLAPGTDYSVSGDTLTFASALTAGADVNGLIIGVAPYQDVEDAVAEVEAMVASIDVETSLAEARLYAFGSSSDARGGLNFWQTAATGDPIEAGSTSGLTVATSDATFGTCLERATTTELSAGVHTRQVWRTTGANLRVKARFKLVSLASGTSANFALRMTRLNNDWTSPGFSSSQTVAVNVGQVAEIEAVFSPDAFGADVVVAAMNTTPYARFGLHMTAPSAPAVFRLESLVVEDVTVSRRTKAVSIVGSGAAYTPLTLRSGQMYFNGSNTVPRVPLTGLFNIQDENGVVHFAMWADLDGDGDYDTDIASKDNLYIAATATVHFRFGDNDQFNGSGFGERGRIRLGTTGSAAGAGTTNVNFVQSGVDFSGSAINDFAIGPYGSSAWWTFWQASTGHMGVGISSPRARLHVLSGASDAAVVQSSANTARIGFRGSAQSDDTTAAIGIDSNGRLVGRGGGIDVYKLGASGMQAGTDNALTLGTGSFRWSVVFAGTGTINTSDEREKQDIGPLPDEWLDAWGDVEWSRYKWRDAVETKADGARWHLGLIAQRVAAAFEARGIDAFSLGIVCRDEWEDEETGQKRDRYGLRYDQAFALEAAYQRRRAERMEARLAALEAKLA